MAVTVDKDAEKTYENTYEEIAQALNKLNDCSKTRPIMQKTKELYIILCLKMVCLYRFFS